MVFAHVIANPQDQRVVRLTLTAEGERRLAVLAASHLEELARLRPSLQRLWTGL